MYEDLEFAAQVSKIGFISVVPIWWGPRPASVENFFPKSNQTLFEYSQGPIFTGANLETAKMLLPVLKAATEQVGANPSKLALSGNSRGGTLALNIAASTPEVSAVVPIVAPFLPPQLQGIVSTPTTQGWETQPKSILKELMQPTMVISALNDQVVPPASTRDYLGAAQATGKTNIQSTWIDGNHQLTFEYNPDFQAKTLKALTDFLLTNMK
jgi:predicted esterase